MKKTKKNEEKPKKNKLDNEATIDVDDTNVADLAVLTVVQKKCEQEKGEEGRKEERKRNERKTERKK